MEHDEGTPVNKHGLSPGPKDYKKFELKNKLYFLIKDLKSELQLVNMSDGVIMLFETRKIKFIVTKNNVEQKVDSLFLKDKLLNGWVIKGIDCNEFLAKKE